MYNEYIMNMIGKYIPPIKKNYLKLQNKIDKLKAGRNKDEI